MPDEIATTTEAPQAAPVSETTQTQATETQTTDTTSKETVKPVKTQNTEENNEPQVRSRMSPKDFIIARQTAKIEKLKAEAMSSTTDDETEDEETGEDDEIAPQDEKLISKVVAEKFSPLIEKHLQAEDAQEVSSFIKDNPDFAPYEKKVSEFMKHESRRHLPIKSIFYEVAGDDLLKIGAERARQADNEAKQTQTGGGSNRGGNAPKSAWSMTKEEFEAEQLKVLTNNK